MAEGWIKLHREIEQNFLFKEKRVFSRFEAWMDILLQANFKERKCVFGNKILTCHRGECLYSLDTWAARWSWNKSRVNRFFALLVEEKMVDVKNETVTTRITVLKYEHYQDARNADETQVKRKWNAGETEVKPTKERKKDKKERNNICDETSSPPATNSKRRSALHDKMYEIFKVNNEADWLDKDFIIANKVIGRIKKWLLNKDKFKANPELITDELILRAFSHILENAENDKWFAENGLTISMIHSGFNSLINKRQTETA